MPTTPHPFELARSKLLAEKIHTTITDHGGQISFAEFMSMALYTPHLGYYSSEQIIFGAHGDFMTAPEYSGLFAECFTKTWRAFTEKTGLTTFVEIGAGSGVFARDFLRNLISSKCLPEKYFIIETSKILRQRQQKFLAEQLPDLFSRIYWLDELPDNFAGMIFANEVLDALPVHCFHWKNNKLLERCVSHDGEQFIWGARPANALLQNKFQQIRQECSLPDSYQAEICLVMINWIKQLTAKIQNGAVIFIDYGYGRREYYHPARVNGTLTCFYRHQQSTNPLQLPGLIDITAHVDFTALAEILTDNNLHFAGFTTQAAFLLELGLLKQANIAMSPEAIFAQSQTIKRLTLPTEMGETVKVMLAATDPDLILPGFSLQDRRRDL